jgi:hypothetical protein
MTYTETEIALTKAFDAELRPALVERPAAEILAAFPGDVAVSLDGLFCASELGIVRPGESGYWPLPSGRDLAFWDALLIRQGRATRAPTAAEREAAVNGSIFGWTVPAADPLNFADRAA